MKEEVRAPSEEDWNWLNAAEAHILQLLRQRYGNVTLRRTQADLEIAQRLIDDDALTPKDTLELQCLGVVLGNVLDAQTSMEWARVSNEYGDNLALNSDEIAFTLYPLTMVSKRFEDGRRVVLLELFRSFVNDLHL